MELLAPARRLESAVAAFEAGADAVYIGIPGFNARRMANEVNLDDIAKLVAYAHKIGKKVYGAINILIKDEEVKRLIETLFFLDSIDIDAVIFQDYGVLYIVREFFPNLEIHASTQTFVTSVETLKMLQNFGVSRVILPRETTIDEIVEYRKETNLELEVFIHGALCHSVSGVCQFSGALTGKSGNRGMCIQACRKMFEDENREKREFFSMKDLWVGEEILKLLPYIDSFKIEGRLKSPEWTSEVVSYYRAILNKNRDNLSKKSNKIKELFSRETTKGLIFNSKDIITKKFTGHIGKSLGDIISIKKNGIVVSLSQKLAIRDGVFVERLKKSYAVLSIYKNRKKINVANIGETVLLILRDVPKIYRDDRLFKHSDNSKKFSVKKIETKKSKPIITLSIKNSDGGYSFIANYRGNLLCQLELKHSGELSKNSVKDIFLDIFSKSGDYDFDLNVEVLDDLNYFINKSNLKDFKRELNSLISQEFNNYKNEFIKKVVNSLEFENRGNIKQKKRYVIDDVVLSINSNILKKADELILPLQADIDNSKIVYNIPVVVKNREIRELNNLIRIKLLEAKKLGKVLKFYVQSINSLAILNKFRDEFEFEILGGPFLHTINRASYHFFKKYFGIEDFTVSYEFTVDNSLPDWFWRVKYSEIMPLFVDVKSRSRTYYSNEFKTKFIKRKSSIINSDVLISETPVGSFSNYKYEQEEFLLFENINKKNSKLANFSFKVY